MVPHTLWFKCSCFQVQDLLRDSQSEAVTLRAEVLSLRSQLQVSCATGSCDAEVITIKEDSLVTSASIMVQMSRAAGE